MPRSSGHRLTRVTGPSVACALSFCLFGCGADRADLAAPDAGLSLPTGPDPASTAPSADRPDQTNTPPAAANGPGDPFEPQAGADPAQPFEPATPGGAGDPVVPLFDADTRRQPELVYDRGDGIVTRFGDRARDRHAREDQFQSYDHYLPHYWEYRTIRVRFVDRVAKGGDGIDVSFVTEWKLGPPEFRAWYYGMGTVAHYSGNYAPGFVVEGPGTYDDEHVRVDDAGTQYKYSYTIESAIALDGHHEPLARGQFMEIEISEFLDAPPVGRENYYGTVLLYEVGVGGLVPWHAVGDFDDKASERENSHKLDERAWLGGRTTLSYQYSDEPDNHFMQMATNLAGENAQPFVRGRRVHHTNMRDGSHDESADNGTFDALVGLIGGPHVQQSCDGCHTRNGRAAVAAPGVPLERWVFKVAGADGEPHRALGRVLQPRSRDGGDSSEGQVSIAGWDEPVPGLRAPRFEFAGETPARVSARIAPKLVGLGLLEAIDEATILALEDPDDLDGDGISGRANRVDDPVTGERRLGRFGWKAAASSLRHQAAAALRTDMGVLTSVYPTPDCGAAQADCGEPGARPLPDAKLDDLVTYVALLGVRARRAIDDPKALAGEALFERLGCDGCHVSKLQTGPFHPFAELREQRIHPYTDLLLHDLGEGLADNLGEGEASGAEWRTTPLWGIGLSPCVTGGVEGPFQHQVCTPSESYLHDGRARTLEEAIRWHGGEAETSRDAFDALSDAERASLIAFLRSL